MKILQLNVWMGKIEGNLKRFLQENDFDIICLQEVFASDDCQGHLARLCFDLSQIVEASGLEHVFFSPNWCSDIANGHFEEGNLILSRIPFLKTHDTFINGQYSEHTVLGEKISNNLNIQVAELENGLTVVNHHGFWRPNPLGDRDSIKAFEKVASIIRPLSEQGPLVMCGDLNIIHESPAMRPLDFLRDLTSEAGIKTTLSGLKFNGAVPCDHILINDRVKSSDFTVYPDLVSDHLALSAKLELE